MGKQYIQAVRGTRDYYGDDMVRYRHVAEAARHTASLFRFDEMRTPMFEFSDVFHRSLGDSSDVVSKETYSFEDRGGESLTLRPECTAAIVRAFISGGYTQQLPFKVFYEGPAFRYERPQKGRLRQFHQVGVEALGVTSPAHDAEVIACAHQFLTTLLGNHASELTLELNTLGDTDSRNAYRSALVAYFEQHKAKLSAESQMRLEKNPLRILDSKQAEDQALVADAPLFEDFLNEASRLWFQTVCTTLDALEIPYQRSQRLVRGLDYYSHTVFEYTTKELGSQATVLAGGRYDGLVEQLGGPSIPAVGWAAGVERLMLMLEHYGMMPDHPHAHLAWVVTDEALLPQALGLIAKCRHANIPTDYIQHRNIGKGLKKAEASGATHALVFGSDEAASLTFNVKHLDSGESIHYTDLSSMIQAIAPHNSAKGD